MRRRALAAAVAGALTLSGCGFQGLYSAPLPGGANLGDHPYSVTIEFDNVLDLVPQSAVKVNDVAVGKVTSIALGDDKGKWVARVKVSVNGSVKLPSNARASILQTSLLGEKYVSLMPPAGTPDATTELHNGSTIDISRTNSAPEAEQVLGALSLLLNEGGLRQIKAIAIELNQALGGKDRQAAIRDLIGQLGTFVGTLDSQKTDITNALDSIDTLSRTLNRQKQILAQALDTFPAALKVLSQERTKLVTLLTSLSNLGAVANRVINATQQQLVTSLKALDPVVTKLTAVGDDLPKALRIAGTFPFPLGITRDFVKGDYANLDAVVNLNLTDQLCGLGLCLGNSLATVGSSSAGAKRVTSSSATSTPLSPMLVGAGR